MTRPIGFRPHRLLAAVALLSAAGLGASGCGFKPLYGDSGAVGAPGVQSSLQQVAIAPIQTRTGQILRNFLIDRMSPRGQPGGGAGYSLTIRLAIQKQELGIRRDETATRANLIMTAIYRLTEQSSGATVFQALSRSVTSYNILDNEFSTVMAERDARSRGAEQLADDITTRVALYFNRTKRPVAGK
jgi:LPS-assembly lipoprotein